MPKKGESVLGGHAVLCVGYDDAKQMWLVRNSWGTSWGILGYFWMPYAYLTSTTLASDLWVLQSVNQK
jgi:C1A family cysteine protease